MVIAEGPGGIGTRIVSKEYPAVEGITAGTTKQRTASPSLEPEENLTPQDQR